MKRKEHEAEVRRRITKAARRLFQEQGFNQTTIRQITQAAEVNTGTLYHFYQDKEDIFSNIVREVFFRVLQITNELVPTENKPLQIACELSYHIHSMMLDARTAELYVVTYNSARISRVTLEAQVERSIELFADTHPELTEEEHRIRAMFVRGFLQSLALRVADGEQVVADWVITQAVTLVLRMYQISGDIITKVLHDLPGLSIEKRVREAEKSTKELS